MKTYTLKEVSRILDIPKSTLRYWEKEGLIYAERNKQNEYREYTTEELMVIGDIAFYRRLHVPMKALKNLYEQRIEDKYTFMEEAYGRLEQQIKELHHTQQKIRQRMDAVHTFESLKKGLLQNNVPDFSYIYRLHMEHEDSIKAYLDNHNVLAIVFDESHFEIDRYGIIQQRYHEEQTMLWKKAENVSYLPCLVRVVDQHVIQSDLQDVLDQLHAQHRNIGHIFGSYLVTDKDTDYFQSWIEVIDDL